MRVSSLTLFAALIVLASRLPAQTPSPLTGVWQATVGVTYAPWTIVLEQRGDSLAGNVRQNGGLRGPAHIRDGHIDHARVTFNATSPSGDRTINFIGTVQGDSITFTRTVVGSPAGATGFFGAGGAQRFVAHPIDVSSKRCPVSSPRGGPHV